MTIRDRAPDPHAHLPSRSKPVSRRSNPKPVRRTSKRISLALQGGGSLGAFTWGVLDRLLEEDDLTFDAISGASAGAMNAVVVAAGLLAGGKPEARRRLDHFWERLSQIAPPKSGATTSLVADMTSRFLSPYQLNPLNLNPLEALLSAEVDFEALRANPPVRLLIAATSVSNGRLQIFRETELTREMVLASGCLPMLSQAVQINGERYWDGAYAANPPLIALVEASDASDMLIVQIMPTAGQELPVSAPDIVNHDGAGGRLREPGPSVFTEAAKAAPSSHFRRAGAFGTKRGQRRQSRWAVPANPARKRAGGCGNLACLRRKASRSCSKA